MTDFVGGWPVLAFPSSIATATDYGLQIQSEPTVCREISTPSLDTLSKDMRGVFCPSDSHHVRRHLENPLNFRPEICGETASQNASRFCISTLLQRFACARLSQPCLSESCPDVSATFTTIAFDDSSLRWLEINT